MNHLGKKPHSNYLYGQIRIIIDHNYTEANILFD